MIFNSNYAVSIFLIECDLLDIMTSIDEYSSTFIDAFHIIIYHRPVCFKSWASFPLFIAFFLLRCFVYTQMKLLFDGIVLRIFFRFFHSLALTALYNSSCLLHNIKCTFFLPIPNMWIQTKEKKIRWVTKRIPFNFSCSIFLSLSLSHI